MGANNTKFTYEFVKSIFEENDCVLINTDYLGANSKLKYYCTCGQIAETTFSVYKNSKYKKCRKCSNRLKTSTKYDIDYMYKYFVDQGCILLENEFINVKTNMKYICICGELSYVSFDNFKRGVRCYNCGKKKQIEKQKHSFEYVEKYFLDHDCTLLSSQYRNSKEKLKYRCSCGNVSSITFANFMSGKRCMNCSGNKKPTHEEIKNYLATFGYTLHSNVYERARANLEIECRKGHRRAVSLYQIKQNSDCPYCTGHIRYTLSDVRLYFANQGCKLLEENYKDSKQVLFFNCKCGRKDSKSFQVFKRNNCCRYCMSDKRALERKFKFEDVVEYFSINNYTLIDTSYHGINEKLNVKCANNHTAQISFGQFKQGHRCLSCQNINRYTYDHVKNEFKKRNCTLLSKTYKNANSPLKYICKCGTKSKIRFSSFLRGSNCKNCGYKKISDHSRTPISQIEKYFQLKNCKLLSEIYLHEDQKLDYLCSCGNTSTVTWRNFKRGHIYCAECTSYNVSGKNNWNYRLDLSDEERITKRKYMEYGKWIRKVYKRDNYTCQCCGQYGKKLNAHHLDGYEWCKSGRTDVCNGITLCEVCHKDFHYVFGYGSNTKEQFEEYMEGISWDCKELYVTP